MKKVIIAFDVDGTLRCNAEERHRTEIESNSRIIALWETLSTFKNVELHIWSNRGADYCREIAKEFKLKKCKGYHLKEWRKMQEVQVRQRHDPYAFTATKADAFIPDIAIDDQQEFDGGMLNLIVREK